MSTVQPAASQRLMPYGMRSQCARAARRVFTGSIKLSEVKDKERQEIALFLEQTAALYDRLKAVQPGVEALLAAHDAEGVSRV